MPMVSLSRSKSRESVKDRFSNAVVRVSPGPPRSRKSHATHPRAGQPSADQPHLVQGEALAQVITLRNVCPWWPIFILPLEGETRSIVPC